MILHIDMDAFFASIEQAINPRLKGRPLIVGSRPNKLHTVVCAASYEAKEYGIDSGMPSQEAFTLCPNLEFVPANQDRYIWTSRQIYQILKAYDFPSQYASIDEFQLDIGQEANPVMLAQKIQRHIQAAFRITASIGIARNCLLAKLTSKLNKPNGVTWINEENITSLLEATAVEKLCGIGSSSKTILHNLGIYTCLNLYQKPASFLKSVFGKNGLNLYASLHANERLELELVDAKPKSIGHSYTLVCATQNPGFIHAWLRLLSEMVARRLRQQNLTAKTVHIWLNGPKMPYFSCQRTYSEATNDGCDIFNKCLAIMAKNQAKIGKIRALGVSCSSLFYNQHPPLFGFQKRREELLQALDHINNRFGEDTIYPASTSEICRKNK